MQGTLKMTEPQPVVPSEFWEERFSRELSLAAASWWSLGLAFNSWMYRLRRDVFLRAVKTFAVPGPETRVIEIGPGPGFYVALWEKYGVRSLTALDFSPTALESLRARFPRYDFRRSDIAAELPADLVGVGDVVTAVDVLFHILDDAKYRSAWKNLASALKPGGILVVTENYLHGEEQRHATQVSRTIETIDGITADAGLELLSRRPAFVLLNAPVDGAHPLLEFSWRFSSRIAKRGRAWGSAIGRVLYYADSILTRLYREGPSSEIAVYRRRP
jgi:SAM-dependent methyltransferase